jgi:hypothetical protein
MFAGWVEHPSRLRLADAAAAEQWRGSYRRAAMMQAGLAVIALLLGLWSWARTGDVWLLAAGGLVAAAIPWTLIVMMPLNRRLAHGSGEDRRRGLAASRNRRSPRHRDSAETEPSPGWRIEQRGTAECHAVIPGRLGQAEAPHL